MTPLPSPQQFFRRHAEVCDDHLTRMQDLWEEMAHRYDAVADAHGFQCRGCADNCCRSLFYHHTLVEYLVLYRGFAALPGAARAEARQRAGKVATVEEGGGREGGDRPWCPLAQGGRCMVYAHRPMICRLHGVPHQLHHPLRGTLQGPGCAAFEAGCGDRDAGRLDRTPLYGQMAELEKSLRKATGFDGRIRLTVAGMVRRF